MNGIFEVIMLLCFFAAWPMSVIKSYRARTTTGKSLGFLITIIVGYIAGIVNKCVNGVDYVIIFYVINLLIVSTDLALYFRNLRLDKKNGIR